MNVALPTLSPKINTEAAQLLAILRDCGIDRVWKNPETNLLAFYLRNSEENDADIRSEIGYFTYAGFVKQITYWWMYQELGSELTELYWFLRYADGSLLKQALQTSARENLYMPSKKLVYNEQHPGFAKDDADFGKIVTLFLLEGFPREIHYRHDYLISRLNYYQYFQQQHGDIAILNSFRRSLTRKESKNLSEIIRQSGRIIIPFEPNTTCAKRYAKMTSYDRLRLMRYYRFVMARQENREVS